MIKKAIEMQTLCLKKYKFFQEKMLTTLLKGYQGNELFNKLIDYENELIKIERKAEISKDFIDCEWYILNNGYCINTDEKCNPKGCKNIQSIEVINNCLEAE